MNLKPEQIQLLREAIAKTKDKLHRMATDHRDLHGTVSKVGKTIDRNFVSDFSSTTKNDVMLEEENIQLLNKVIAQHLHRNNLDDVATTLIHEAKLDSDELTSDPFSELHRIWEAIYNGDLTEALDWAIVNSDKLQARNSSLEFKLHRIAFLQVSYKRKSSIQNQYDRLCINSINNYRKWMQKMVVVLQSKPLVTQENIFLNLSINLKKIYNS